VEIMNGMGGYLLGAKWCGVVCRSKVVHVAVVAVDVHVRGYSTWK
jgi:hypothetical protein